jgi:hypothetical protein
MGEQSPTSGIADYILDLARRHGVRYVETPTDALANMITRLSDDEVILDEIELLIFALKRAHVIDADTMVVLLGRYLDEKDHV